MTGGAYVALFLPVLVAWAQQVSALVAVGHGLRSWLLTLLGLGVLAWGLRDLASGLALSSRAVVQEA